METAEKKRPRWVLIAGTGVALAALIAGAYILTAKFLEDRRSVAGFSERARPRRSTSARPEVKTYTAEELEKARREGTLPKGMAPYTPPPNPAPADAAIQRTLRTLDEINRINQMNQRLMEQQQRQNRNR